ncbi:F-box protein [Medicago truncatula]|uniref:F-box protein n=1 Tax=Medicago truncatula TaxID=3880 RepID=A0A072USG8_MEDTR|nr:F-box protein [Medicago truncatula]
MEQEEDRLSNLPIIILHHILSSLPEKDVARTSVLSKTWANTRFTFSKLSFSDVKFRGWIPQSKDDFERKRKKFIDYVTRTLSRFCDRGLTIKECKITLNHFELHCMSKDVNFWLKSTSESGVEVLELCLPSGPNHDEEGHDECYVLPMGVIEAKSLTKLVLMGGIRIDQAFMHQSIKFFSLIVLSLWEVLLGNEHAIEHLISCCPLIEHITLNRCLVLSLGGGTKLMKCLSMLGLPKLKTVDVQGIQEVYVDAPCLENLYYCHDVLDAPFKIHFDSCRNLKVVYLSNLKGNTITNEWFLDLFLKFPFLEILKFANCTMSETINISSVQLKVLELSHCLNLKEVNIDAPNLLSCTYTIGVVDGLEPVMSFVRSSSKLEVDVEIYIHYMELGYLKEFLQNIKPENVLASLSLSLFIYGRVEDGRNPVFQVSSPPPSIKHLHLRYFPKHYTLFSSLLSIILSKCCSTTISMSLHPCCSKEFLKFFYETLMRRKDDDCVCGSSDTKCWWHGLKDLKVSTSKKIDENVDFKTWLESWTEIPNEDIIFRLKF